MYAHQAKSLANHWKIISYSHFPNCRICTQGILVSISYISEVSRTMTTKIKWTRPQRAMTDSPETDVVVTT